MELGSWLTSIADRDDREAQLSFEDVLLALHHPNFPSWRTHDYFQQVKFTLLQQSASASRRQRCRFWHRLATIEQGGDHHAEAGESFMLCANVMGRERGLAAIQLHHSWAQTARKIGHQHQYRYSLDLIIREIKGLWQNGDDCTQLKEIFDQSMMQKTLMNEAQRAEYHLSQEQKGEITSGTSRRGSAPFMPEQRALMLFLEDADQEV